MAEHAERFAENDLNDSDDRSTLTVGIRRQPIGATILAAFVQRFVLSA